MEGPSLLVDREPELAGLAASLEAAVQGEGSLVVIAGGAGTGKSALMAATAEQARKLDMTVRRGRGSELEQELSFGVIRQLFEVPLKSAPAAERERLLSGAAGAAARLFEDAPLDQGGTGDGGFVTLHGIYWLAAGIAAERPLVLAVDDAHWVDGPTLRALNYLAGRIADVPIALVVAVRSHEPSGVADLVAGLESHPAAQRFELSVLGPAAVARIVRAEIPAASDELCAAFHESSAGNPLYVRELLRTVDSGDGVAPTTAAVRQAAVASVAERVMRRIAALGPRAPRLAASMSVLGASGRLRDAAAVAEQEDHVAAEAARAMRRVEILAADDPFEWIHPLVRRSIYDGLSVTERDALHLRAADVLAGAGAPPGVVAAHLSSLRPAGSARVVAGLRAAAAEALARDAPDVAVAFLRRALEEETTDPSRAALLLELGQIEVTRRNPQAAEVLREARELSADPRERALAALAMAEGLTHDCKWDAAAETVSAALDEFDGLDPDVARELELARAVVSAVDPALAPSFWRDKEQLLELSRDDSWTGRALSALFALTFAFQGKAPDEVLPLCDRALADGTLIAERGAGAWVPAHVLGALVTVEAYERADAFAADLERAARMQGSVANTFIVEMYRGWAATRLGDLANAEEILRPLVNATHENGMGLALVTALWWMIDVILERPSLEDLGTLIECIEVPEPFMAAAGGAWVMLARGRVRALRGARAEAEEDLRAAGRILDRLGFGPLHDPWRSALALVLPADRGEESRELAAEELALAEAAGLARPRGIALRAVGLVAGGDEGIERLRESVAVLSCSPARYEHARSLVELGASLRRSGRRADSREPLEAGMELAYLCGAERLVGRARDELLAAGARPRKVVRCGFAALTASERRIVRLASEGRSNPEIAQALYVSVKTVETHLSSAYRRLDLSGPGSRRRLPELVAEADRATHA
jgi:tetratricopeptide (TPR) repeat protein